MSNREYPRPMKGSRVTCLGCNKGKVMTSQGIRDCKPCKGKGYIIAE